MKATIIKTGKQVEVVEIIPATSGMIYAVKFPNSTKIYYYPSNEVKTI